MNSDDQVLNSKYIRLLNSLNQIKKEMGTTQEVFKELQSLCNESIKINNACVEDDLFSNIKNNQNHNVAGINRTISYIQRKI